MDGRELQNFINEEITETCPRNILSVADDLLFRQFFS